MMATMDNDRPRVLVLANRQVLSAISPAVTVALEYLELERARLQEITRPYIRESFDGIDVIIADVTRPSPSISFQLGVAEAIGVPVLYIASDISRVAPVFSPVIAFDAKLMRIEVGWLIARHLRDLLVERGFTVPLIPEELGNMELPGQYEVGEIFDGTIVHIDRQSGFVLIGSPNRRPAMLHASRMSDSFLAAFEAGEITEGMTVTSRVVAMDRSRESVQLEDLSWLRSDPTNSTTDRAAAASLLQKSAELADLLASGPRASWMEREDLDRFQSLFADELHTVRDVRNRVAHSEPVPVETLLDANSTAEELLRLLREKVKTGHRFPLGTTARTGQTCPQSGIWEVNGSPSANTAVAKGSTMPPFNGAAVTWNLKQPA